MIIVQKLFIIQLRYASQGGKVWFLTKVDGNFYCIEKTYRKTSIQRLYVKE